MRKKSFLVSLLAAIFIFSFTANAEGKQNELGAVGLPSEYSLQVSLGDIQNSIIVYIDEKKLEIDVGSQGYLELMNQFLFEDNDISSVLSQYYGDYAAHYVNIAASGEENKFEDELWKTLGDLKNENSDIMEKIIEPDNIVSPTQRAAYDVARAQAYAERYATSWNYVFGRRANGDCTNFASQIVNYAGIPMNSEWQYNGDAMAKRNWNVAQDFTEYMTLVKGYNGGLFTTRAEVNSKASPGDCIAYMRRGTTQIFHVAFVQSKLNGYIYLTQHSDDFYNVKFNDRISESKMNSDYYVVIVDYTR